jgi:hypothetical protein
LQQADFLAERLKSEAGQEPGAQVSRAWQLAFNRAPAPDELKDAESFAESEGFPALCRGLFNANEFMFIP